MNTVDVRTMGEILPRRAPAGPAIFTFEVTGFDRAAQVAELLNPELTRDRLMEAIHGETAAVGHWIVTG